PTPTVTSDHYQICRPILGSLHDLCGGVADLHKLPSWSPATSTTRYAREECLCVLFGHRNKLARRDPALNAEPYCGIDYMDQSHVALQRVGELHPTLVGVCRNRTGIDRDEDSSEAHVSYEYRMSFTSGERSRPG